MRRKSAAFWIPLILVLIIATACGQQSALETTKSSQNSSQNESENKQDAATETEAPHISLKVAYTPGKGSAVDTAAGIFKEKVEERSGGRIEVNLFPDGTLGKDTAVLDALKMGSIEVSVIGSVVSSKVPEFDVFEIPFLFENRAKVAQVANGEVWEQDLKNALRKHDLEGLGFWEAGFRHITNNVRPINKPEDLKGITLRVPDSKIRVLMFKEMGANPTPINLSETFTALQQGVVDGQENPFSNAIGQRFEEVQKYLSLTGHTYTPAFLLASKIWFDAQSAADQALLTEVASEVGDIMRAMGEEDDNRDLEYLKTKLEVNQADIAAFREFTKPIIEMVKQEIEPNFVDKVINAAQ